MDKKHGNRMQGGSCLCGGVSYRIGDALRDIVACHCLQCRKTSGHHVAATRADAAAVTMTSSETLTWYRSSETAERGFCNRCGGNMFWRRVGSDKISIMAGTLDDPVDLPMNRHIFVKYKGDYYQVPGDAEQFYESD
ncbi:MAG: GFA family protein [Pseudomonadota bacterium]